MHPATEQKYEHQQCQETSATVYNSKEIIHIQISFKNLQLLLTAKETHFQHHLAMTLQNRLHEITQNVNVILYLLCNVLCVVTGLMKYPLGNCLSKGCF